MHAWEADGQAGLSSYKRKLPSAFPQGTRAHKGTNGPHTGACPGGPGPDNHNF